MAKRSVVDNFLGNGKVQVYGDSVLQTEVLEDLACAVNYREWLCEMARPYLGSNPIELGSGTGEYANFWLKNGTPRITLTEADEDRLAILKNKFGNDPRVELKFINLNELVSGNYSAFISFNVFEHLEDDLQAFEAAKNLISKDGYVVTFVPAYNFLYSKFDKEVGHFRRYRKKEIKSKICAAGLEPIEVKYVNFFGFFAWLVMIKILRTRPKDGLMLSIWDKFAVPFMRYTEQRISPPIGQSILSIARIPTEKS